MQTQTQTQTLVSKLLATEDISVVRRNTSTASFDIEKRELTLPNWKDMSVSMEMMLIGHEVSHALHTTQFYVDKIKGFNKPNFDSYMNVVEDARIERMIKRKYPGLRKDFFEASRELYERDMMGTSKKSIKKFPFIDRINIFFKVGNHVLVPFTPAEKILVDKVDSTVTEQDVYDVAVEIYNFESQPENKQKQEEQTEDEKPEDSESDQEDQEEQESSGAGESDKGQDEENTSGKPEKSEDSGQEESVESGKDEQQQSDEESDNTESKEVTPAASETSSELDKTLSGMVSTRSTENVKLDELYPVNVVDEKTFITAARNLMNATTTWEDVSPRSTILFKNGAENFAKFRVSANKMVNHLVTEFEMRKAADQQKRTQISKSGQLNMSKIAEYKIVDDMFKRFDIVTDAQNHGMIIMLDWSGSMATRWKNTVEQLSILILFLKRVGIKFEVHAFSDNQFLTVDPACDAIRDSHSLGSYTRKIQDLFNKALAVRESKRKIVDDAKSSGSCISYWDSKPIIASIIKVASNKMSTADIEYVLKFLYIRPTNFARSIGNPISTAYSFGTTPTNQALIFEIDYVNKFQRTNNIQKMNTVILTDGSPTSTYISYEGSPHTPTHIYRDTEIICSLKGSRTPIPLTVITDRNIPYHVSPHIMCTLLKFFKNMTDSTLTMYYISPAKANKARFELSNLFQIKDCDINEFIRPIISQVNKNSWAVIEHETIDKLVFVSADEDETDVFSKIDGSKSASALAREITKLSVESFNKKAFARTLIDTFN